MNAEGQLVNTATPSGAGTSAASISTVEPDEHGNILRELTAQNRLRALQAGSSTAETAAKSKELDTHRTFSADGTEMLEEWGPLHQIRLEESGTSKQARLHRVVQYENPAPPSGTPAYHLPTRETTGASIVGEGVDADQRVTETVYDWTLRKPKETIVDPNGLNIRRYTAYDSATGMPTEIRQPEGSSGGDAHTTQIHYYRGDATGPVPCRNQPAKAGLPCEVTPAAQPGTDGQPDLLVKKFVSYAPFGQPTEVIETLSGNVFRTSLATYDGLGRPVLRGQIGGTSNGVEALRPVETVYDTATGMPERQRFSCWEENGECNEIDDQEIIMDFDELGRLTGYQDADENVSTTTYDLLGRPVTVFDGKGTQTRKYDSITGLLVELEDSSAGTFTASYDADGNLAERGLPNGLTAKTTFDEAGQATALTYTKASNCGTSCTWLDFTAQRSIYGQVNSQSSTLSSQQFSYDKAGRLILTKDTPQGGSCTTRTYRYDDDSNRTELVTRAPGVGGACDTSSAGSTQSYSYDDADRLIGSGISYDGAGRITELPAVYAGGKPLETIYYQNNLVAAQSQNGITNSYELDSSLRPRLRKQTGGSNETEVFHYAGGSDSPAWTERGEGEWTRSVAGINGELAAIEDSASGTILQLTNLHGDVVATADLSSSATSLLDTFEFDEFGNAKQEGPRYGWLGGKTRRTELASGVIQMGVRSYVPVLGRFLTPDPVFGGSANSYEYANGDPVNQFDLSGEWASPRKWWDKVMKAKRDARRESGAHNIQNAVIKSRTCTAVACKIGWGGGGSGRDPVSDFVAGVANNVLHYLYNNPAATQADVVGFVGTIYNGLSSPAGRRAASCAKEATTGWREVAGLRGVPLGGVAAGLYTATKCVVGFVSG